MAIITQRIEVCDVCRSAALPVNRFRLAVGTGRLRTYVLCAEDGAPFMRFLSKMGETTTGAVHMRRGNRQVRMDQIEEIKVSRAAERQETRRARVTTPLASPLKGSARVFEPAARQPTVGSRTHHKSTPVLRGTRQKPSSVSAS